jgi:hypothetical protein
MYGKKHTEDSINQQKVTIKDKLDNSSIYMAKGRKWYYNPSTKETTYFIEGHQPKGWIEGRIKTWKSAKTYPSKRRKILCIELNKVFDCGQDCCDFFKVGRSGIQRQLKDNTKTIKGYHIKYI